MLLMQYSSHKKFLIVAGAIVLLVGVYVLVTSNKQQQDLPPESVQRPERTFIRTVEYECAEGKHITATYYAGPEQPKPKPGEPPVPSGSVEVSLDGGEQSTLRQTISASGVRYSNEDESFVFWNKGEEALIMRDNAMDLDYTSCIEKK